MLVKIKKIQDQVFDFKWDENLQKFNKHNLIYGWNGTGKTYLTNFLENNLKRYFENKNDSSALCFCSNSTINKFKIFNKRFVESHVFTDKDGTSTFIVAGEENVRIHNKIQAIKNETSQSRYDIEFKNERIQKIDNHIVQEVEKTLDSLRSGVEKAFKSFHRSKIKNFADEITSNPEFAKEFQNKDIDILKKRLKGDEFQNLDDSKKILSFSDNIDTLKLKEILTTKPSCPDNVVTILEWLEKGVRHHDEGDMCKFCESGKLTKQRLEKIQSYFNKSYENLKNNIKTMSKSIEELLKNIDDINYESESKICDEELREKYRIFLTDFQTNKKDYIIKIKIIHTMIIRKQSSLFLITLENDVVDVINNIDRCFELLKKISKNLNCKIKKNNTILPNIEEARELYYKVFMLQNCYNLFDLTKEKNKLNKEIQQHEKNISDEDEKVNVLKNKMYDKSAQDISKDFSSYLGRSDITLEYNNSNKSYSVKRENSCVTQHLSEGEKTAFAFVYFLNTLNEINLETEKKFRIEESIVIIDDPISSLDSNNISAALSFMAERTEKAGQIFILTHSLDFMNQVKIWFNKQFNSKENKYFMLEEIKKIDSPRRSRLIKMYASIEKNHSEYQYLFTILYEAQEDFKKMKHKDNIKKYLHIPNTLRRFLEIYVSFLSPSNEKPGIDLLRNVFNNNEYEGNVDALIRFANIHSHSSIEKRITRCDLDILMNGHCFLGNFMKALEKHNRNLYDRLVAIAKKEKQATENL